MSSKRSISIIEVFDYLAIKYFGELAVYIAKTFELEQAIRRAGLDIYPPLYAARLILYTVIALLISLYSIFIILLTGLSLTVKIALSMVLLSIPILVYAIGLSYPSYKAGERRSWVESEISLFAAYLTAMAIAGLDVVSTLDRVARLQVFRGIRDEALRILKSIRILGKDPLDAIEFNSSNHPSPLYRDFMLGFSATTKIGGSIIGYLEMKTSDIFKSKIEELKLMAERIALYTELYIIISVIMSVSLYIFFTISSLFPGTGFGGPTQLVLFSFIFMPLITLLLIYLVDKTQPRNPVRIPKLYEAILVYGVPSAIVSVLILAYLTGSYKLLAGALDRDTIIASNVTLAGALVALSIPSSYLWIIESRKLKGMGDSLASFLRDLVEIRKMGLSPEKSIVVLSNRDYGPLNPIIRKIAASLSLGFDMERAVASALRGYYNWMLISTLRFLTDAITLGGGSIETIDSLARYTRSLADFESELSRRLKIYVIMPYIGAVMVAGSSMMILSYTAQTLTLNPQQSTLLEDLGRITLIVSLGALFNSWLMGIMAGKLSRGSIVAGFQHSIILTIIALLVIAFTVSSIPGL
ncbi:MAG: type II secretion system F family protein [Acidilobaceae archaeon]